MANDQGASPGAVLFAFVVGAAVGAIAALLYAPATGEETREFLNQRAREGREKAADAARQGRDALNRQKDNLSTAFERAREQRGTTGPGRKEEQDA